MSARKAWGRTANGEIVDKVVLQNGPLRAEVITFGAILRDLRYVGHAAPLVLGLNSVADYEADPAYLGAVVGRFANRIAGARMSVDGVDYILDANENGSMLHGGKAGFSRQNWSIEGLSDNEVTLCLQSPDGDMGFPGNLTVRCTYALEDQGVLRVAFNAETDAPTVCSLAQHSYFNLQDGGASSIHDHQLTLLADAYLPVNALLIPAGAPENIDGVWLDFRQTREIGPSQIDHNYCLSQERVPVRPVARLASPASGMALELATTEPGLQVYTGDGLSGGTAGLDKTFYRTRAGIALETQVWPDAPNRPEFPSAFLRPGLPLQQVTQLRFIKS
ncbi:MAG: aldose epimerase family protein [Pseudomonadota bacterium]